MTEPRRDTNWWGWGDPMRRTELDATALGVLRERIGELEPWPLAARIEDFELPAARPLPRAVIDAVGEAAVFDGKEDRLRHARRARLRRPGAAALRAASRTRPTRCSSPPTRRRSDG